MPIDRDEIVRLTEQYGGEWGINHTRRLLALVEHVAVVYTTALRGCSSVG
ncbi:MAG TPA: hypothetical protein VMH50_12845 [Thermoleophilia bacterium]|nr:hypothetical protein [Thermoleophilia bacterium]